MNNLEKEYQNALDWIYSFVDNSLTRNLGPSDENFIIDRMVALAEALQNPQNDYPIIHVAGTKGKGSTCAFYEAALRESGYVTGLYTSPHLVDFNERIQVNRVPITNEELVAYVEKIKPAVAKVKGVTTFDIATAIAMLYFRDQKVDIAILEVGLGGRLDSTNIVEPILTTITSISLDHMKVLGSTIDKIASEKAGIIKPGIPVVIAPQKPEAMKAIKQTAKQRKSPIILPQKLYKIEKNQHTLEMQQFVVTNTKTDEKLTLNIPLIGDFQIENALNAMSGLQFLKFIGWKITNNSIVEGFSKVVWPGRMEIIHKKPMVIIDSAHNLDSFEKLKSTIELYLPGKTIRLIFGASEDKDVESMLKTISPAVAGITFSESIHPRAFSAVDLWKIGKKYHKKVEVILPIENAFGYLQKTIEKEDVILVAGSIFIGAAARELWLKG
ncbi:MAG TPA: folylpolyglutamate synthase/dihydrofolate synthase family protein [Bellilinea sp.]|nr:folylpolyglutamate synthase/dihydrofolate synthase family protein [Bellilinea sp.]